MKSVILYFGSFNPIHKGHIAVAEWVLEHDFCDELWFVVSPQNPLKEQSGLIGEQHRLNMIELVIADSHYADRMHTCDVEFGMPKPSYTIDTLRALSAIYPNIEFSLLAGSDIVEQIENWKEWQKLLSDYKIFIYPRRYCKRDDKDGKFILLDEAPYKDYSSTEVRRALQTGGCRDIDMMPKSVMEYIDEYELWKTII